MIETPQRKPSVLRIGGRYLLSTSTTVGSLTVAENAELVMGENLELQTRGILVKGLGFYICEASCQFTYPHAGWDWDSHDSICFGMGLMGLLYLHYMTYYMTIWTS